MFNAATHQKLLDCNHSMAHNFKEEWLGGWGVGANQAKFGVSAGFHLLNPVLLAPLRRLQG